MIPAGAFAPWATFGATLDKAHAHAAARRMRWTGWPVVRSQMRRNGQVSCVRFTPISGHVRCNGPCLLWANSGHQCYSITSFARNRNASEIFNPSTLAVVKLIMRSNFVGCSTGRSDGFAPLSILSTYSAARRNKSGKFGP
jgi:hypothetical protein